MKKKISIGLIIIVTIACIFSGIQTRKQNGFQVTQIQTNLPESLSYLIETTNHTNLMIDGGAYEDSEMLEEILIQKGGIVDSWFITIAHSQNFGALQKIIENGKVQINHIYISFNSREWYQTYEPDRYPEIAQFLDLMYSQSMLGKVQEIPNRFVTLIDNLYVTALNVKNPEMNQTYAGFNQSMVIKVNNTYKSMIFMGNIAQTAAEQFRENNMDEIDCDAVQISNNEQQNISDEIYQKMTPDYLFMSAPKNGEQEEAKKYLEKVKQKVKAKQTYLSSNEPVTIKIW